jgi:hypothetical protein
MNYTLSDLIVAEVMRMPSSFFGIEMICKPNKPESSHAGYESEETGEHFDCLIELATSEYTTVEISTSFIQHVCPRAEGTILAPPLPVITTLAIEKLGADE